MTIPDLVIRHLCFTGLDKPTATLEFEKGLNVLYGASETGKSFALETIDFMLGGRGPLRDIPERVGYERILLGLDSSLAGTFTLVRSTIGGPFSLYKGLHQSLPEDVEPRVLGQKHSDKTEDNLSSFLLGLIGLENKRVRKSMRNETKSLSFRDICHLCIVGESDMQKQGSPIESGQYMLKTPEYATFKLLLTGVDDSALVSTPRQEAVSQLPAAKLEVLDELIIRYRNKLTDYKKSPEDLTIELSELESMISNQQQALNVSEEQYQDLMRRRNKLHKEFQSGLDRRGEIDELLARFSLLDEHYLSDLSRLESVSEAGTLLATLTQQICPLCGAEPNEQHRDRDCDGNLEAVVTAAEAETRKILQLRHELEDTISQLKSEAEYFEQLFPKIRTELKKLDEEMRAISPRLDDFQVKYVQLVEKRAALSSSLSIWNDLIDLQARREELEAVPPVSTSVTDETAYLSSSTLDQFAKQVEALLRKWNFPNVDRVYFDEANRDLVINGKRRGSRGKGLRAITHAAFTLGLLEFCNSYKKQHPGFVILDSPLLAYREPEGQEDDLTGTDVQDRFYEYLSNSNIGQVIVIENIDPPKEILRPPESLFFSKNPHHGRYGLFPTQDMPKQ